eukprot:5506-Heterococcus_DN1.PRE.1
MARHSPRLSQAVVLTAMPSVMKAAALRDSDLGSTLSEPLPVTLPPETPANQPVTTVIWFIVSVPVLSLFVMTINVQSSAYDSASV